MTMTLDHDGVRALLPHRPPMLLIDTAEVIRTSREILTVQAWADAHKD